MQAHPLSNTAARIPSTSSLASHPGPQPRTRSLPSSRLPDNLASLSASAASVSPAPTFAAAGLAHDACNLLGALGLYCDLLNAPGVLRPEHRHYAAELRLIAERSSTLIRRLLSAPPAVDIPPQTPTLRDLTQTLRDLAPILQRIAADAAMVSVSCPASLPSLGFPSEIIERIALNLVRNAAEAIRNNPKAPRPNEIPGQIHVTLAVLATHLRLTVEDNGPGISPAVAAAFLQPSPLPRGATRGLGHRIVHQLATTSGGQLSVRVRPGKGTAFCLKWPIPEPHRARSGSSTSSVKTA